jgi:hypothetical protein
MITRTSRGEWQRRAVTAETKVAELRRELADAVTEHAAGAARQEAAHADAVTGALETARHNIVKGLKGALGGCGHNPPRPSCARCRNVAAAISVVEAVVTGGTAAAEDDGA